jgi:hypothetical protein
MVVAMLALFVALTGTTVAASNALITGRQIANNSITGLDVRNKSLTPKDFKGSVRGPRGLRGLAGAKGDKGDKGDTGPSNAYSVNSTAVLPWTGGEQVVASLALAAGKYVLSGFATANNNAATQESVLCRIVLGGATIADSSLVNLGANGALDRQVLALSVGGTLAAAGSAEYRCTPTTATGNFIGQGLTAVQAATLNGA